MLTVILLIGGLLTIGVFEYLKLFLQVKALSKKVDKLSEKMIIFQESNEILMRYCLENVLKNALEREDYLTAQECSDLLNSED